MSFEVFRRERLIAVKIVVEAVLDHRPDGDLRSRPQALYRFGEDVRGIMADELKHARVVAVEKFNFCVVFDRIGKIGKLAVERHRHRPFGKRR